jgi:hypothetical protein
MRSDLSVQALVPLLFRDKIFPHFFLRFSRYPLFNQPRDVGNTRGRPAGRCRGPNRSGVCASGLLRTGLREGQPRFPGSGSGYRVWAAGNGGSHQTRSQTATMSRVARDRAQPRHAFLVLHRPRHLGHDPVYPLTLTVCFFLISTIGLLMQISPKFNFPTLMLLSCPPLLCIPSLAGCLSLGRCWCNTDFS